MPTITALKRGRRKRLQVFLEGSFAFTVEGKVAAELEVGQSLSVAEVAVLIEGNLSHRCHEAALRFLSYRPRSQAEVRRRLAQRGFPPQAIEGVVGKLQGQGLLDDEAFARFWREAREGTSPRSAHLLRRELRTKGVDHETARGATQELNEEEGAYQAARQKLSRWATLDYDQFRRKAWDFLRRRGYHWETIRRTIERLRQEQASQAEDAMWPVSEVKGHTPVKE